MPDLSKLVIDLIRHRSMLVQWSQPTTVVLMCVFDVVGVPYFGEHGNPTPQRE